MMSSQSIAAAIARHTPTPNSSPQEGGEPASLARAISSLDVSTGVAPIVPFPVAPRAHPHDVGEGQGGEYLGTWPTRASA